MRTHFFITILLLTFPARIGFSEETKPLNQAHQTADADKETRNEKLPAGWRCDPSIRRHPGSYFAGGIAYSQSRAWFRPTDDEFDDSIFVGPVHGWQSTIRVGDAFFEWFAVGFQIDFASAPKKDTDTMAGFGLLLDTTFYPWRGFGIRPSVGLGFSYAVGEYDFEMGFGGPLDLSLALTYEFRLTRLWVIAPVAQTYWIKGDDYNSLYFSFGLELMKWFDTPTG